MSYRILKLRSGEEIIGKITGNANDKMVIERPMIFKNMMVQDRYGNTKELTVLRNWIPNSVHNTTKIPRDHVASFLTPNTESIKLYELEKEYEDKGGTEAKLMDKKPSDYLSDFGSPDDTKATNKIIADLLESLLEVDNYSEEEYSDEVEEKDLNELLKDFSNSFKNDEEDIPVEEELPMSNMVSLTMFFPPELIPSMINKGLIAPKQLAEILLTLDKNSSGKFSPISDIYTGEREGDDLGNFWTDWPSDLEDYLKGKEDDKKDND